MEKKQVLIEIVSDPVCPWCYIAKRKLDKAIEVYKDKLQFKIRWLPFELRPQIPKGGVDMDEFCPDWLGHPREDVDHYFQGPFQQNGMKLKLSDKMPNTFNAHRIIHLADEYDKQHEMSELLFKWYWLEGRDIGDLAVLNDAARYLGIPNALDYLKSDQDVQTIRNLEANNRVRGVPQFKINGSTLSGAEANFSSLFAKLV